MSNPARKHHFIPIFYTKWWAGDDGLVERFTKHREVVVRRVHPARVGWQENLYQIPQTAPELEQALEERFFKQLDNISARALRKMNAKPMVPLTNEETTAWSLFMMSLLHRTPEYLAATKAASRRIWQQTLPGLRPRYQELREETDPLTFEEYVQQRDPIETEQSLLWSLPQLIANPRIGQFLNDMHWLAIDIPPGRHELLLSDNPLARTNGIKMPGGHIAMPLSPRRLLVATWEKEMAQFFDRMPVRDLVSSMNRWTVESACHFVVARTTAQERFILRYFGANPKPALNASVR